MRCFYEEGKLVAESTIVLNQSESRHCVKVMRLRAGDTLQLLDGCGNVASGILEQADARAAQVWLQSVTNCPESMTALHLAQVIPKGKSMDSIVRKATEIGVRSIFPLLSDRAEVRLEIDKFASKCAGWRSHAIEACKQCGSPFLPVIHPPQSLESFFQQQANTFAGATWRIIASLEKNAFHLSRYLARPDLMPKQPEPPDKLSTATLPSMPKDAIIMVGSEGDFTPDEYVRAGACQFLPITLANNVLRSETAAVYALSVIDYELNRGI